MEYVISFADQIMLCTKRNFMAKDKIWMKESGNNVRKMIQIDILMKAGVHTGSRVDLAVQLEMSASILSTAVKNHKLAVHSASLGYYPYFVTSKPDPRLLFPV
jgi:NMD protein affecting ribosome stability and mRNA decay